MSFLTTMFRAATPENPRFSLNDPAAWDAFGVTKSASGVTVNRETALTYSPWWRGVNLLSSDVAKLSLLIYRRVGSDPEDGKELATDHQAYQLLRHKPNERQTAHVWKKQMTAHALTEGNAYSVIDRLGDGTPAALLPLDPTSTYPVVESRDGAPGRLWYVTAVGGSQRKILPENMWHMKGLSFDGLVGYSVWQKAIDSLGLAIGTKKFATTSLKNFGRPAVVLTHPGTLTEPVKTTLAANWERMHAGIDNAARTAILDRGMQLKEYSFNARDLQLAQTFEFSIRDIANFLGLAPHKLGDTSRTAYSSLEQENQSYLDEGLDPWLVNFEDECRDKLLREAEKEDDSVVVEFDRRALLRADRAALANYYRAALAGQPWMTVNEVRERDGLNPDDDGDKIMQPMNMGQGGQQNEPALPGKPPPKQLPAPAPKDNKKAELKAVLNLSITDTVSRMVRRIGTHAERAAAKGGKAFVEWVDTFVGEHSEPVWSALKPVEAMAAAMSDDGRPKERELAGWLMATLRVDWGKVADTATANTLTAAVADEIKVQEVRIPKDAIYIFVGEDDAN